MTNENILAERYESLALSVVEAVCDITLLKNYVARCANAPDNDTAAIAQDKIHVLESLADCIAVDAEQIWLDITRLARVLQGQNQQERSRS